MDCGLKYLFVEDTGSGSVTHVIPNLSLYIMCVYESL